MTPEEKVRFLIKQSQNSSELCSQITGAKPGEIMYWNFPHGPEPMAQCLGDGLGVLGGSLVDFDRLVGPPGTHRTDFDRQGNPMPVRSNDVPELIEEEVRKHLPPGYQVGVQRAMARDAYSVMVWHLAEKDKAELTGTAFVDNMMVVIKREEWRAILLNDLADDITRRCRECA